MINSIGCSRYQHFWQCLNLNVLLQIEYSCYVMYTIAKCQRTLKIFFLLKIVYRMTTSVPNRKWYECKWSKMQAAKIGVEWLFLWFSQGKRISFHRLYLETPRNSFPNVQFRLNTDSLFYKHSTCIFNPSRWILIELKSAQEVTIRINDVFQEAWIVEWWHTTVDEWTFYCFLFCILLSNKIRFMHSPIRVRVLYVFEINRIFRTLKDI